MTDTTENDAVTVRLTAAGRAMMQPSVDQALQDAHDSLSLAARLATTSNGERASRALGGQFDVALLALETLLELREGERARNAARFGVAGPNVPPDEKQ